jgi:predicted short-subunit dehydrogenase-like oxidoreductase (DUF2520 family)
MKIVLIGAGNVATHLGTGWKKAGHTIVQVYSRTSSSANKLAKKLASKSCTDIKSISDKADLYIVSLSDHAVKTFLKTFPVTNKVVAHTSGSLPLSTFGKKFRHCGVIYPLQTFSISRKVNLAHVPFCIEWSDPEAKRKIEAAVKSISKKNFLLNSPKRKQAHLAAVFANNFSNHLFSISEKILSDSGLSFDLIRPLILETALKVQSDSPTHMQTGPAKRGDAEIINEHLRMLAKKKELQKVYELLTESISEHQGMRL